MNTPYQELTGFDVGLAALLILINGVVSIILRLRLERTLLIASLRTILQLLLIGVILEWVFEARYWYVVIPITLAMTLIAGLTAMQRGERRYAGMWANTIISMWASSWLVTAFALFAILRGIEHWYDPQYAIPLLGMVLGNTLNGISLGLNTFTEALATQRHQIDGLLALGATRWEAARPSIQRAVRTGLVPIVNSMMIVGLVSLPGMMTGQLLSGTEPIQAVKYQIVIMFLIASATALGTVGVVMLSAMRLFNHDHQFLHARLKDRPKR